MVQQRSAKVNAAPFWRQISVDSRLARTRVEGDRRWVLGRCEDEELIKEGSVACYQNVGEVIEWDGWSPAS